MNEKDLFAAACEMRCDRVKAGWKAVESRKGDAHESAIVVICNLMRLGSKHAVDFLILQCVLSCIGGPGIVHEGKEYIPFNRYISLGLG